MFIQLHKIIAIIFFVLLPFLAIAEDASTSAVPAVQDKLQTEFWYKIMYKGEKVGYMQTKWEEMVYMEIPVWKITDVVTPLRFGSEGSVNKSSRVVYISKENLSFLEGVTETQIVGNSFEIKFSVDGNNIIFEYPERPELKIALPKNKPCLDFTVLGKWLIGKDLGLGKTYNTKIIAEDSVANQIPGLNIKSKGKLTEKIADRDVEGYSLECNFSSPALSQGNFKIFIDQNGHFVKISTLEKEAILTTKDDARGRERKTFQKNNRYDPFIPRGGTNWKPPKEAVPSNQSSANVISQLDFVTQVQKAESLLEKLGEVADNSNYTKVQKEERFTPIYQEILVIQEKINKTDLDPLKKRMEVVMAKANTIFPAAQQIVAKSIQLQQQAEQVFLQIKKDGKNAIKEGHFSSLTGKLQELKSLHVRPEIDGTLFKDDVGQIINEVLELTNRADVVYEFLTSSNLNIDGIVYFEKTDAPGEEPLLPLSLNFFGLPIDETLSFKRYYKIAAALINGKFYNEDTEIDKDKKIHLKSITENKEIIFTYKNEEIIINTD